MDYISVSQLSTIWGISSRRIQILCKEGRVPGSMRVGNMWIIPAGAQKPIDERIHNGKGKNEKRKIGVNSGERLRN